MGAAGTWHVETDLAHGLLEEIPVLGACNRLGICADELHAVALQDAALVEFHRKVERGLPAQGREKGVGALAADHFMEVVGGQRLNVGSVGAVGIGHHRRGVGIDEHDLVTEALERLDGLYA